MRYLLALAAAVTMFAQDVRLDEPVSATAMYLGGSGNDAPSRAKVDPSGNAYIIGGTDSPELPARQFLVKAAPSGAIIYAASLFDTRFATAPGTLIDLEVARDGTAWVLRDPFNQTDVIKIDPGSSQVFSVSLGQPGGGQQNRRCGASLAAAHDGTARRAGFVRPRCRPRRLERRLRAQCGSVPDAREPQRVGARHRASP